MMEILKTIVHYADITLAILSVVIVLSGMIAPALRHRNELSEASSWTYIQLALFVAGTTSLRFWKDYAKRRSVVSKTAVIVFILWLLVYIGFGWAVLSYVGVTVFTVLCGWVPCPAMFAAEAAEEFK